MASLALYRKYRSQDFNELIGQAHITVSLENALSSGRISHAYLFSGPRGVGKTSAARILARRINGLKPVEAARHLDIIEIDAASNRRIDEIRDLREKVHSAPTSAKYKVYIIDEVHMLTNEAFNALLKTLEEPPEHVVFILATTEAHKLPDTIISRTQHYNFRPIDVSTISKHLQTIANAEKINIDADALELLAIAGDGSFRDSISLLDQLANLKGGKISTQDVSNLLGLADSQLIENIAQALVDKNTSLLLSMLDTASAQGFNAIQLLQQMLRFWQKILRVKVASLKTTNSVVTGLAQKLNINQISSIMQSLSANLAQPGLSTYALEASLVQLCLPQKEAEASNATTTTSVVSAVEVETPYPKTQKTERVTKKPIQLKKQVEPTNFDEDSWLRALTYLKTRNNSLYALLRSGNAVYEDGVVVVRFRFQFHRRRLEEVKNKALIEEALEKVLGQPVPVRAVVTEQAAQESSLISEVKPQMHEDKEALDNVLQILGGEVVNG